LPPKKNLKLSKFRISVLSFAKLRTGRQNFWSDSRRREAAISRGSAENDFQLFPTNTTKDDLSSCLGQDGVYPSTGVIPCFLRQKKSNSKVFGIYKKPLA